MSVEDKVRELDLEEKAQEIRAFRKFLENLRLWIAYGVFIGIPLYILGISVIYKTDSLEQSLTYSYRHLIENPKPISNFVGGLVETVIESI